MVARDSDLSLCEEGAAAVVQSTTPTECSPLLVQTTANPLPDWASFLTSTPMQTIKRQAAGSSTSSSTTASQDALHNLNMARTRQLFALSGMSSPHPPSSERDSGRIDRPCKPPRCDLDTPTTSHSSSSSSTTDSTECEAVRLLPLPPRVLPQPLRSPTTLTTSISMTASSSSSLPQSLGL